MEKVSTKSLMLSLLILVSARCISACLVFYGYDCYRNRKTCIINVDNPPIMEGAAPASPGDRQQGIQMQQLGVPPRGVLSTRPTGFVPITLNPILVGGSDQAEGRNQEGAPTG